ncbi:hypothetical protein IV487_04570 [Enterococcus saccharolyticus]|uniref:Colicin V production protein n=1 Tax=Candidatus Enterococcus willemsii TaxID=1857215 RepID=A0ABQ6YYS2_9ENTE|nr:MULTISPECIES: hypothetical protein [Enterococcus]KAF1303289.1 hypothetical protein BAU17_08670 [Enterococcus sp. CU12B]MCD5001744.1 hypothetical protein [Enterococcus saccharolyticus]
MENIIAIGIVLLILLFIYKVGSAIWRFLGVLFLVALIWIFRATIMEQINEWSTLIQSGQFWDEIKTFATEGWQTVTRWFGNLVK